jgi:hypothetical protein
MWITAEEFVGLLEEMRRQGRDLRDPDAVRAALLEERPDIEGVYPPPSYEEVLRRYVPDEWREVELLPPPRHHHGPALVAGSPSDSSRASTTPPPDPGQQILADLDLLRSEPMGAMAYVVARGAGAESPEAMHWARFTALTARLMAMTMTSGGRLIASRAISGTTGLPRDSHLTRAESHARFNAAMAGAPALARTSGPCKAAAVARPAYRQQIPPEQVRANLRELQRQHGSGVGRRR